MNDNEMMDRVNALPNRFAGRLDPTDLDDVREAAYAGEWGEAVDNLIAGLAETRAVVTAAERDELRTLLDAMGLPTDLTDGLNVQG
ncbi:MAG TPA: MafI family immunity protein [Streptosporangiaceae bacterium]